MLSRQQAVAAETYGESFPRDHAPYAFADAHPDGLPVAPEEIAMALNHVMRMTPDEPYEPAAAWQRR